MKFKRILAIALCVVMAALSVSAAGNFAKTRTYADGTFEDLAKDKWYYNEVVSSYELGFMNGTSATIFKAEGNVTVAQGITMAARVHSIYNGGTGEFTQGNPWYQVYVDYAVENGFVKEGQFDSFTRNIKRIEMATLFADALPASEFVAKNNVTAIPDVSATNPNYEKLLMLYNAGIVMGSDDYGTFYPNNDIKRSEASAIINRVALPENRLQKTLTEKVATYDNSYYLVDSPSFSGGGWNYDDRLGAYSADVLAKPTILDTSAESHVSLNRNFDALTKGLLTLDLQLKLDAKKDGVFVKFTNDDAKDALLLVEKGGFLYSGDTKINVPFANSADGSMNLNVRADLDKDTAEVYINGVYGGEVAMKDAVISKYEMGITKEGIGGFKVENTRMYYNFMVNEVFNNNPVGTLPSDWKFDGKFAIETTNGVRSADVTSMAIDAAAGSNNVATKSFAAVSGNIVAETYILLEKGQSGAVVALTSGGNDVVKVVTDGNTFKAGNGTELRSFTNNVWQRIRIEADTAAKKAVIKINGKACATVDFETAVSTIDGIKVGFNAAEAAKMWFDDVSVSFYKEPADYVPAPTPVGQDDYLVGMNFCPIWREGHHGQYGGWEPVTGYPELEPVLGFYDEGTAEAADWELKFFAEHGVDFIHVCWYTPSGDVKEPIKKSNFDDFLNDGYFNAKYSDQVKFAIMWENDTTGVKGLENFKEYIWNYWKDYYFTDPRYMVVDNKVVLTAYKIERLENAFGADGVAAAIQFMREDIKTLGFDDIIFLISDGHRQEQYYFNTIKAAGIDGVYAYNWSDYGHLADRQIAQMKTINDGFGIHMVPTISTGFNDIGWTGERSPVLSVEGFDKVADFIKNDFLTKEDQNSWQSKMVMLSNWNEYGEGTYIMPTESLYGFGYLDTVRKYFTNAAAEHEDVVPTAAQKTRISRLTDDDRNIIRALDMEKKETSDIKVIINGTEKAMRFAPVVAGDEVYVPAEADAGFFAVLRFYHEYNRKSGKLLVESRDAKLVFTVGSDKVLVNGKEEKLAKAVTVRDGLPILPLKFMVEKAGGAYKFEDKKITVNTLGQEFEEETGEKLPFHWDWNLPGDDEGWSNMNLTVTVSDGSLNGVSIRPDHAIMSPKIAINAAQHPTIKVRMRHKATDGAMMQMFFTTVLEGSLDEGKSVSMATQGGLDTEGVFYEYTFNMSANSRWKGTVTSLRFDPFTPMGEFSIDYIHVIADPNYVPPVLTEADISVQNGDASDPDTITFFGSNISIVPDMSDMDNNVYLVEAPPKGTYNYIRHGVQFTPGYTYSLEFDVKLMCLSDGSPVTGKKQVSFNAQYVDTDSMTDHVVGYVDADAESWTHFKSEFTIGASDIRDADQLGIFMSPTADGKAVNFYIDNVVFKLVAKGEPPAPRDDNTKFAQEQRNETLQNGNAEGDTNYFYAPGSGISIVSDPANKNNKVYYVDAKDGNLYPYIRQNVVYEPGATYKVTFDVKLTDKSPAKNTYFQFNAQYKGDDGTYDHVDGDNWAVRDVSAKGWSHFECTFTVGASSDRSGDQFAVYANPANGALARYYIDNMTLEKIS